MIKQEKSTGAPSALKLTQTQKGCSKQASRRALLLTGHTFFSLRVIFRAPPILRFACMGYSEAVSGPAVAGLQYPCSRTWRRREAC